MVEIAVSPLPNFADAEVIALPCSDLTTALTTGTSVGYIALPFAFQLVDVWASVLVAPTGTGNLTVDVNQDGTTVISTKLKFDASAFTTKGAATPRVISDTELPANSVITVDIDAVSGTITGKGLIVYLGGYRL